MPMLKGAACELRLPRPLINQLLHIAQSAPAGIQWGFIGARGQVPAHCYPIEKLDTNGIAAAQHKLDQLGEALYALYRVDSGAARVPDLSEIEAFGIKTSFLLGISLGTKGVLQLRGWRVTGQQLSALDIGISEI
jgi:[CysO sulfur-carrier protein]-S-L-cysteine hydrolase